MSVYTHTSSLSLEKYKGAILDLEASRVELLYIHTIRVYIVENNATFVGAGAWVALWLKYLLKSRANRVQSGAAAEDKGVFLNVFLRSCAVRLDHTVGLVPVWCSLGYSRVPLSPAVLMDLKGFQLPREDFWCYYTCASMRMTERGKGIYCCMCIYVYEYAFGLVERAHWGLLASAFMTPKW